jgi:hypothetical protein
MEGEEPGEDRSFRSVNPITMKGEVIRPPFFVIRLIGLLGFLG